MGLGMLALSGGSICSSAHESSGRSSAAGRKEMATYTPPAESTPCTVHSSAATWVRVRVRVRVALTQG